MILLSSKKNTTLRVLFPLLSLFLLMFSNCTRVPTQQKETNKRIEEANAMPMAQAAQSLLATLSDAQQKKAVLSFEDEERSFWHFTPSPHRGLTWEKMNAAQREALSQLLQTSLSQQGLHKTQEIMAHELILRELENRGADDRYRHPELYYLLVFGDPADGNPWGWRFEGHHISLNYTSVDGQVAVTPAFMGANPAEVPSGPQKGKRILAEEEDRARQLLAAFDTAQLSKVLIADRAPRDIVTGNKRKAMMENQEGLPFTEMTSTQQQLLRGLIQVYLGNMEATIAAQQLKKLEEQGWDNLYFAWAGETEKGPDKAHYYRIHGPSLLIEYDNIQTNANHIHTVWRDLTNDFGEDLLKKHHEEKHGH